MRTNFIFFFTAGKKKNIRAFAAKLFICEIELIIEINQIE
jgi:hypothetical protein